MTDNDVLETTDDGRYRVRLVQDDCAEMPYDDGGVPVIFHRYMGDAEQVTEITSYPVAPAILDAFGRWGHNDPETLERYLRIYHGVTTLTPLPDVDRTGAYTALDPADWRERVGAPEGATPDDFRAWLEGEVYGYVIEELVTWHTDGYPDRDLWEHVDSLWGLYGTAWAERSAREAFADYLS